MLKLEGLFVFVGLNPSEAALFVDPNKMDEQTVFKLMCIVGLG